MRIIFLDVDGVLNCLSTKEKFNGFTGIDSELAANLAKLVQRSTEEEETQIVLSSSWRVGQDYSGKQIPGHYKYLSQKLSEHGLSIYDDTPYVNEGSYRGQRGKEITTWLDSQPAGSVSSYVILDDEIFPDFEEYGLLDRLVKTTMFRAGGGFREEHVERALELLQRSIHYDK